jgi:enamine deaminase RidA (YjgF/YER057c/UK114 family)
VTSPITPKPSSSETLLKLSGQGGWDNKGDLDQYDWRQQIDNAFDSVDRVLRIAGFRSWEDVSGFAGRGGDHIASR